MSSSHILTIVIKPEDLCKMVALLGLMSSHYPRFVQGNEEDTLCGKLTLRWSPGYLLEEWELDMIVRHALRVESTLSN